jgi:hypothetical protein
MVDEYVRIYGELTAKESLQAAESEQVMAPQAP